MNITSKNAVKNTVTRNKGEQKENIVLKRKFGF